MPPDAPPAPPAAAPPPGVLGLGARMPVLDGVRGIAILLVLCVHFMPDVRMGHPLLEWIKKGMHGGWAGVDLFFVLSGFLITGILIESRDHPGYFRLFYARRALRIFPLYMAVLVLVFLLLPALTPVRREDPGFAALEGAQGWLWLHAANLASWVHRDWRLTTEWVNLVPFWSLSVEEQFYLLWPLVVRACPPRRLPALLVLLVALPMTGRAAVAVAAPPAEGVFWTFLMPLRTDSLAFGSLLAVLARSWPASRLRALGWTCALAGGLPLLALLWRNKGLWFGSPVMVGAGTSLFTLLFAGCLVLVLLAPPSSPVRRAVDVAPLRALGKVSYGLYVLHALSMPALGKLLPVEAFTGALGAAAGAFALFLLKSGICFAAAAASWRFFEEPCLRWKRRFEYRAGEAPP